jgi:hypothetical protein
VAIALVIVSVAQPAAADPIARAKRASHARPVVRAKPIALAEPAPSVESAPRVEAFAELVSRRWPSVPRGRQLSLSEQITERLTEIGNRFGDHLDLLSQDMFRLQVDARKRRARIRFGGGGGEGDLFTFQVDGDIHFHNLDARVDAHIDLGFGSHMLRLDLPTFHVQAAEYQGEYGVQLAVPMFERRF